MVDAELSRNPCLPSGDAKTDSVPCQRLPPSRGDAESADQAVRCLVTSEAGAHWRDHPSSERPHSPAAPHRACDAAKPVTGHPAGIWSSTCDHSVASVRISHRFAGRTEQTPYLPELRSQSATRSVVKLSQLPGRVCAVPAM